VESPYIIRVAIALLMVAASIEGQSTILNADPIRALTAVRRKPHRYRRRRGVGVSLSAR